MVQTISCDGLGLNLSQRIQNLSRHLFCNRFTVQIYISGFWEMESQLISEHNAALFYLRLPELTVDVSNGVQAKRYSKVSWDTVSTFG